MIKITKNTKLFIWGTDDYVRSGGAEVLNMLAADLKKLGADVKLVSWNYEGIYPQPEYYAQYYNVNCGSWSEVTDSEDTIVLVPEIVLEYHNNIDYFRSFKKAQFMFWWLGTTFLYDYHDVKTSKRLQFQHLKCLSERSLHLCEGEVGLRDCRYYGHDNSILLQHGTNPIFLNYPAKYEKENAVFYNAYKEATKRFVEDVLIPRMPDVEFREIHFEGADKFKTKEEMCDIFDRCKVYVDFCGFEGRELMPREACIRNCILILGNEGHAATFDDYPIPDEYKVDKYGDPEIICNKIRTAISEYETRKDDMLFFKNKCIYEPMKWNWELHNIFGPMLKTNEK